MTAERERLAEVVMAASPGTPTLTALKIAEALADLLAARDRRVRGEAWDEAIEHVWELSDPIETVEHFDGLAMVNTVTDMRQAKRENPYRDEGTDA